MKNKTVDKQIEGYERGGKPPTLRKIMSDKHVSEDTTEFNRFLYGKSEKTQKRYRDYRKAYRKLVAAGFNADKQKRGKSLSFHKLRASDSDLSKDTKPKAQRILYTHWYRYECRTPSLKRKVHRHGYQDFVSKPNQQLADDSHAEMFPDHEVYEREFIGNWENY